MAGKFGDGFNGEWNTGCEFSNLSAMRKLLFFVLSFVLAFAGCREMGADLDPVLARVEKSELKLSEVNADGLWDSLSIEERTSRVEHWVSQQSVYERALSEGIDAQADVALLIENAKKKIVLDAYFDKVADTISVSEEEALAYYEEHPEPFMRNADVYRLAVVTYASGKSAWQNYALVARKKMTEAPVKNWMFRKVDTWDSVTTFPLSCPAVQLRTAELGKLSAPKVCGKDVKSVVVLSKLDSGSVKPFAEVSDFAKTLAFYAKRKDLISAFKNEVKNSQVIFVYPEEIAKSAKNGRQENL